MSEPIEAAMHELLRRRASTRRFSEQAVEAATLRSLIEAARWAPSWGNRQPWRLVYVRDVAAREALARSFTRGNAWAALAPVLVVVAADPAESKSRDGESYYQFDCGLAVAQLIVEAVSHGLVAHPFAGWDEQLVRQALALPPALRVVIVVAVGYPAADPDPSEQRPRERKPLQELVAEDRWGGVPRFLSAE